MFPSVDPIPLPAPIWLFKVLHIVTLSLHFVAMQMLVGGLALVAGLSFWGSRLGQRGMLPLKGAYYISKRLPVVTTYVINFGVPPLLFAQVLYGQAIYTSSILIGVYWISVIFLLTFAYWLLYKITQKTETLQPAWGMALTSLVIIILVGRIYSTNMTLMLRPEVWQDMYSNSAIGALMPPPDPSLTPRWLLMMTGGLAFGGLWMVWISGTTKSIAQEIRHFLEKTGGSVAVIMLAVHLGCGLWVYSVQGEMLIEKLNSDLLFVISGLGWIALSAILLLVSVKSAFKPAASPFVAWLTAGGALVNTVLLVTARDMLRDITLLSKGFDVWNRVVVTNWSVVGIFLGLFVIGLGVVGWLIWVMLQAKNESRFDTLTPTSPRDISERLSQEGVNS